MTETEIIQFGMGEKIGLLKLFLNKGDNTRVAEDYGCTRQYVSQVLTGFQCYASKGVQVQLFRRARENAKKSHVLTDAWQKLFGYNPNEEDRKSA